MKSRLSLCLVPVPLLVACALYFVWSLPSDTGSGTSDRFVFAAEDLPSNEREAGLPSMEPAGRTPLTGNVLEQVSGEPDLSDGVSADFVPEQNSNVRVWPVAPETMESLLLSKLAALPDAGIAVVSSYSCSPTTCVIRFTPNSQVSVIAGLPEGLRVLTNPPYSAVWSIRPTGLSEVELTLRSGQPPAVTPERELERTTEAAAATRRLAENALPPGSHDSPPVVFGQRNGVDQVVEDVCSYDCPLDTRRIIYLAVPEGRSCSAYSATEQRVMVRSRTGIFSERVFCVPNFLIDN